MKYTKHENTTHLSHIKDALETIAIEDGIDQVQTFDLVLANKLRGLCGGARDALSYIESREGVK